MKKYSEYKYSGVQWIGEIPLEWQVCKLKHIGSIIGRIGFRGYTIEDIVPAGLGAVSLSPSNIVDNQLTLHSNTYISWGKYDESPEIQVFKDDVVVVKTGSTIGKVAIVPADQPKMTLNPQLIVIKEIRIFPKYLYYLLISKGVQLFFDIFSAGGSTPAISQEKINNFQIFFPHKRSEQTQIARYLDHKTSKIEKLITDKEKLVELLNEERTAVINQAVTKGLNPDVPMKDSGVEWLGEVPEHWKIIKLYYITSKIGDGLHGTPTYADESNIFFINGNNIGPKSIRITEQTKKVAKEEADKQSISLTADTLLLSINGTIGNLAFYKGERVMLGKSVAYIKCKNEILREYLFYFLQSKANEYYFNRELSGSTIKNLSLESIKRTLVTYPPLAEQKKIVSHIETKIENIEKSVMVIRQEIQLLKEYKTALISEVVTGKVDVRDEIIAESTELVS